MNNKIKYRGIIVIVSKMKVIKNLRIILNKLLKNSEKNLNKLLTCFL